MATPAARAATNGLIAFQTNGSLVTIDPATGLTTPVPNVPVHGNHPAWSPDGTRLAFSSAYLGNADIFVINADGSGLRVLTVDAAADLDPTWSPDGRSIAFASKRLGSSDIYVQDVDAPIAARRLTADPGDEYFPAWSPDGTTIAFEQRSIDGNTDVVLTAPDGSGLTRLTTARVFDGEPAWSPDGTQLAYVTGSVATGFHLAATDTLGNSRVLTPDSPIVAGPAWSPDGLQIAYSTGGGGVAPISLFVIPSDGILGVGSAMLLASPGRFASWAPQAPPVVPAPAQSAPPPPTVSARDLPVGEQIDAANGLLVTFRPASGPAGIPASTTLLEHATFRIDSRTSRTVTLRLRSPRCLAARASAVRAKGPPKSRATVRQRPRGGRYRVLNGRLTAGSHLTAYTVSETCRGSLVNVTEGVVEVRPRRGNRRLVRVRAGHSYFVPASP